MLVLQFDSTNFEELRIFRKYIQVEKYLFHQDIIDFVQIVSLPNSIQPDLHTQKLQEE